MIDGTALFYSVSALSKALKVERARVLSKEFKPSDVTGCYLLNNKHIQWLESLQQIGIILKVAISRAAAFCFSIHGCEFIHTGVTLVQKSWPSCLLVTATPLGQNTLP